MNERIMDLLKTLAKSSERMIDIGDLTKEAREILAEHFSLEGHLDKPPERCPVCECLYLRTRTVYGGSIIVECGICDYQDSW